MKKNITILTILVTLVFTQISCSDFLDNEPIGVLTPQTYYNSPEKLDMALAGVYDVLGYSTLFGREMQYRMDFGVDEGYYSRTSPVVGPAKYNFEAGQRSIQLFWRDLYRGIDRANTLLYHLENFEIENLTVEQYNRIKGETLFLRGFYYFWLAQSFGGVPLILEPTTDLEAIDIPRSTHREVYDQVLLDMTQAEPLVKDIRDIGHGGRVSKSAVRGLLARVNLYMAGEPLNDSSRYAEARSWALKVIDDTKANHKLNPSYHQVFINYAADEYDINESIWEIEFWGDGSGSYNETGAIGYVNGVRSADIEGYGEGWGGYYITNKLFETYKDGDLRKWWNIANFRVVAGGGITWMGISGPIAVYQLYAGKFRREYEKVFPKARSVTPINFPLLRYADVLLMFAEAENEMNGATQLAIDAVNQVIERSISTGIESIEIVDPGSGYTSAPTVNVEGSDPDNLKVSVSVLNGEIRTFTFAKDKVYGEARGTGFTTPPVITFTGGGGSGAQAVAKLYDKNDFLLDYNLSQEDLREEIQDERMRELAFELVRKGDLIRWGTLVFEMHQIADHLNRNANATTKGIAIGYGNVQERHTIWPIPTKEITLNHNLTQNPYW